MLVESMHQFAQEILYPLAARADHNETFPQELWQHAKDLGLNEYALPEALGGVADHLNIVSNILITEQLGQGDFSLAAGLLSGFSAINALSRWGSEQIQAKYLTAFNHLNDLKATFATQENSSAFNPFQLDTQAIFKDQQFYITGEKTLVLLGETADLLLVSADYNGQADVFVAIRDSTISYKKCPAIGIKAC